jgi:flavodoxin
MKCLLVLFSFHHNNTEKVARAIASVLDAEIQTPQQTDPEELREYDLVGFGSGIYGEKHHKALLNLADELPSADGRKAFLFSTSFNTWDVAGNHSALRGRLEAKGYEIVGDFNCAGYNTNSFLKYIGGLNKGRPNAEDLKRAEEFAHHLMASFE